MRVLLVDDSATNLIVLGGLVKAVGATPVPCADPRSALSNATEIAPDLVVVDQEMPGMTGLELIGAWRNAEALPDVPVVMITANEDVAIRHAALAAGATDFIRRPIDAVEVKSRMRNLLRLRQVQRQLADRAAWLADAVAEATRTIAAREEEIIMRLARAAEHRDCDTGAHIVRMARYCEIVARRLGLSPEVCHTIYLAAPMHDVGKIGIIDSVLLKPGKLSPDERAVIERHTLYGEEILEGSQSELIELARDIAGAHHERWDGCGYPRGLAGEQIPLAGRIAAVADVFDALTSARPYKAPWSPEAARDRIVAESGRHFDPACVTAFLQGWDAIREIAVKAQAETIDPAAAACA